jgi:hypothetical protein
MDSETTFPKIKRKSIKAICQLEFTRRTKWIISAEPATEPENYPAQNATELECTEIPSVMRVLEHGTCQGPVGSNVMAVVEKVSTGRFHH